MKAKEKTRFVWAKAIKIKTRLFLLPALITVLFYSYPGYAQYPMVTVRFANPEYTCATQTYSLDVEFQCDSANQQLHGMNVRFYYDEDILEFLAFGEFVAGYGVTNPNPPLVETDTTDTEGEEMFGFDGSWEYINGAIKKTSAMTTTYLSTTGWTKLFNVNFHVDDPESLKDPSFCPAVVWDLKENPSEGGFRGGGGVVITLVKVYPNQTKSAIENVQQFNWQYDYTPGLPFGAPAETSCISTLSSYAPKTTLPYCGMSTAGAVSVPIRVEDFNAVKSFTLIYKYYPTAITYSGSSSNPIFNSQNGLLTIADGSAAGGMRKITLTFNGLNTISLPDNAILATINFNYIGGETVLEWRTDASFYYGPGNVQKCNTPTSDYLINGGVISNLAPITKIDSAIALEGNLATLTVRTWDFDDIRSGVLNLNYDDDVLTFSEALPNAAIADSFAVDATAPGNLELSFFDADTSLADGSVLMYVTFQYIGGSSPLTWFDDGASCQYFHCHLEDPMTDSPQTTYYLNGNISSSVFVWDGGNSEDWNSPANWPNNTLPDQFTSVTLDPNADPSFWPTFTGDFILGEDCKDLSLTGSANLTIEGDLVINPGHTLNLGSGTIYVTGDWINSGTFIPGTGTVEFTGSGDISIDEGVPPANYVAAYIRSTFTSAYNSITGGNSGPSGDNAQTDVNLGFSFTYLGTSYSQVRISTNGWLSLNLSGDVSTSHDNTLLFSTSTPAVALAPWWDDLSADANSSIVYITEGTAPERVFTAEWKNILAYNTGATARLNFQVKLYETSNEIEFRYGSVTAGTHYTLESASIGIKDLTGGPGHFIEATQNSTNIILAVLKSETNWPASNYKFSAPVVPLMDTFYKIVVSKPSGNLNIGRNVMVTGLN